MLVDPMREPLGPEICTLGIEKISRIPNYLSNNSPFVSGNGFVSDRWIRDPRQDPIQSR